MSRKIYSRSALLAKVKRLKAQKKKIVFTNGCFDVLHYGHVSYLRSAKKCGDFLVVGLNSDKSIRSIKGPTRPINAQRDRSEVLSELTCVDAVCLFNADTPYELIKAVKPDVLVKGADWKKEQIAGYDIVSAYGGKVRLIRLLPGRSSTHTIKKIGLSEGK